MHPLNVYTSKYIQLVSLSRLGGHKDSAPHALTPIGERNASLQDSGTGGFAEKARLRTACLIGCLICGRQPCDPHHLRFAQPRALGLKLSDEFTVLLCRGHHRQLHQAGNEVRWWNNLQFKPLEIAKGLWEESLMKKNPTAAQAAQQQSATDRPKAAPQQDAGKLPNEAN